MYQKRKKKFFVQPQNEITKHTFVFEKKTQQGDGDGGGSTQQKRINLVKKYNGFRFFIRLFLAKSFLQNDHCAEKRLARKKVFAR